jgi:glycosyltransferase involved in cell wall biosynthesis
MKIIAAFSRYGSTAPSGENKMFKAEVELLRSNGHIVEEVVRDSDEIRRRGLLGLIIGGVTVPWSHSAKVEMRRMCHAHLPDVVHVHNTFPLLSPSIFYGIHSGSARIFRLPNYRLFCASGFLFRNGSVCRECVDEASAIPGVRHGCYRSSRTATIPVAAGIELHRMLRTWQCKVDAFVVLSDFQKQLLSEAGLPKELLHVKPNFIVPDRLEVSWLRREEQVVYAGRLSAEKGVEHLISAWRLWGEAAPRLVIVGDGPLRQSLESMARGLPIVFAGHVDSSVVASYVAAARLVIVPSVWYETFGLIVIEAFAVGTPVAVSDIGPLPSLVKSGTTGIKFSPGNAASMFQSIQACWESGRLEAMGAAARREFEAKYTEEVNYRQLMDIYAQAIEVRKSRQRKK